MKYIPLAFVIFLFFSCQFRTVKNTSPEKSSSDSAKYEQVQFSVRELESFLDSVGNLSPKQWIEKVSFFSDSIFRSGQALNDSLNPEDFKELKAACKSKLIDQKFARKILPDLILDSAFLKMEKIPLALISFDRHDSDFKEFAVCAGNPELADSCELYFFQSNKIISKHLNYNRYGLSIDHFKDSDGRTIVYYIENYESGSGIWWSNYYFYKYYGHQLIPVLNEIQNANLQPGWSIRVLNLEASILKINPLTMKMVYYQELPDTSNNLHSIVSDSTIIRYQWNEKSKTLDGNYANSKLSMPQKLSFYLQDNELLFINSYHSRLRNMLNDSLLVRSATLDFLNKVKNVTRNKSH
jgi:hypothetical protein